MTSHRRTSRRLGTGSWRTDCGRGLSAINLVNDLAVPRAAANLVVVTDALCVTVRICLLVPIARRVVAAATLVAPDETAVAEALG